MKLRALVLFILCLFICCASACAAAPADPAAIAGLLPSHTLISGVSDGDTLHLLMQNPAGETVFVGGVQLPDGTWSFTESTPLPADAYFVSDTSIQLVIPTIRNRSTVTLLPFNGVWGVSTLAYNDNTPFSMGEMWISETTPLTGALGDHPWRDITKIDWSKLPTSYKQAAAQVNNARWGLVKSASAPLLQSPSPSSAALMQCIPGAPVCAREFRDGYARVLLGNTEGWIALEHIALNVKMSEVTPAPIALLDGYSSIYSHPDSTDALPIPADSGVAYALATSSGCTYIWFPETGTYGYVRGSVQYKGGLPAQPVATAAPRPTQTAVTPKNPHFDPQFPGYTYVDGVQNDNYRFLILRNDRGQQVLVCAQKSASGTWTYSEPSTPLPGGACFEREMPFENGLSIPAGKYSIVLYFSTNGSTWYVSSVNYRATRCYNLGPQHIAEPYADDFEATLCTHPWSDITTVNWNSIPTTYQEALRHADTSDWYVISTPAGKETAMLYPIPAVISESIASYYSGTPVRLISKENGWGKVAIGNMEGWLPMDSLSSKCWSGSAPLHIRKF